jgi:predicted ATPase/class 3 adenylate cyclase
MEQDKARPTDGMDVAAWLRSLGLERYAPAFHENEVGWELLPKVTADDLKDLGVLLAGHRRKLLDAIATLGSKPSAAAIAISPDLPAVVDAERRQLTILFCDLVDSTALSARLDPEDLHAVIAAYHRVVGDVVAEFDGFVSQYSGDGILAYFGYPQAHEDDAERAVRAGLHIIEGVSRLSVKSVRLQGRVGIATGLVVVGNLNGAGSPQEQSSVGETPNLAARLQMLAEPNAVVIDARTRRLVGDLFEHRDLGAFQVKGIAAPVPVSRVLRAGSIESRFEALRGSALTQLVGREEELDMLSRRWARAKAGDGQIVLVVGEPGIGKSRIATAFSEHIRAEPHLRLRYLCSPYRQDSALYPFIDQLSRASQFGHDDTPAIRLEKLEALLSRTAPPSEDVALIADLLSLPNSERHPSPNLSPQRKKERTLQALLRQLEGLARQAPVIMVLEDAHWIDPTSRELLDHTVERVRTLPVLLIVTFRPQFQPSWTGQPQVTTLALNRMDRRDRAALVAQVAGSKTLPADVIAQIIDRTDGVPLFIEELTKSILESGLLREEADRYVFDGALQPFAIPTSLHASLLARLDRLASVRLVAQIGAAIGREFSYTLLRTVSRLPEDELQGALDRLVASELVFQRSAPPDAVYIFKHALVQDAAHDSLLRTARQQLHAQIARALEADFPELLNSQPEVFAQHYTEAGLVRESIACWAKAGHRSIARLAMAEAAAQFDKALRQLALLPDDLERQRQELEVCSALGAVLRGVKGQAAAETGQAYARARALWEKLGYPSGFLQIPYGQSLYHMVRGELDLALRLDEDLLNLSRQRGDSAGLLMGHVSNGRNLMLIGTFALSRMHLEEGIALHNPVSHHSLAHQAGIHPSSLAYLGNVLFCLGFPDQAMAQSDAALANARRLAHPQSLAVNLAVISRLLALAGDNAVLGERVDQLVALTTEQGFPYWAAQATIYRGWVKVMNGDITEGISLLRSGLAAYRATGAAAWTTHYLALLAKACELAGQIEEASSLMDDALRIVERTGEGWFAAELNRSKGQLLLQQGNSRAAEVSYRQALNIAKEQEARLWELRAAVSLARLQRDQGRQQEARDILAPIYNWFTEGFGTSDLKEARVLLDQLG